MKTSQRGGRVMRRAFIGLVAVALTVTGCTASPGGNESEPAPANDVSADLPQEIIERGSIIIGTREDSAPNGFRDENGDLTGYEYDMIVAVADVLGIGVEAEVTTFDGIIPGLQAGRFDVSFGNMGSTLERQKVVDFVTNLEAMENLIVLNDSGIEIDDLNDVCGHVVGLARGSLEEKFAEAQNKECIANGLEELTANVYQSGADAYVALNAERIDIVWSSGPKAKYLVDQSNGEMSVAHTYPTGQVLSFVFPKDSDLTTAVRAGMNEIIENGTYADIAATWGLTDMAITESVLNPTTDPSID